MSAVDRRPGPVTREVGEADVHVWRDLRLRALQDSPGAFGSTYEREAGFTDEDWRERTLIGDGVAVLGLLDGVPVGLGGGFRDLPGWLHVVAMWTVPEHRGKGVGSAVLAHLVDRARQERLRVHLDVAVANPSARRAYERSGFVATGETRPLRPGSADLTERMVLPD